MWIAVAKQISILDIFLVNLEPVELRRGFHQLMLVCCREALMSAWRISRPLRQSAKAPIVGGGGVGSGG